MPYVNWCVPETDDQIFNPAEHINYKDAELQRVQCDYAKRLGRLNNTFKKSPTDRIIILEDMGQAFTGKTSALNHLILQLIYNPDYRDLDILTLICPEWCDMFAFGNNNIYSQLKDKLETRNQRYVHEKIPLRFHYNDFKGFDDRNYKKSLQLDTNVSIEDPVSAFRVNALKMLLWERMVAAAHSFVNFMNSKDQTPRLTLLVFERGLYDMMGMDLALEAYLKDHIASTDIRNFLGNATNPYILFDIVGRDVMHDNVVLQSDYRTIQNLRAYYGLESWVARTYKEIDLVTSFTSLDVSVSGQRRAIKKNGVYFGDIVNPNTWAYQSWGYLVAERFIEMTHPDTGTGLVRINGDYDGVLTKSEIAFRDVGLLLHAAQENLNRS